MPSRKIRLGAPRVVGAAAAALALAGIWAGGASHVAGAARAEASADMAAQAWREPGLRLISQSQYVNTIARLFGPDVAVKIRLAPVNRVNGLLAVGQSSAVLTSGGFDPLEAAARSIAEQVVQPQRRGFLFPCEPTDVHAANDACAGAFLGRVGRFLYRGPLSGAELERVVAIANRATAVSGDFYGGVAFALSGMLVSPQFLFIREASEPDPAQPGMWRLDVYSKASRLSFLLWDSAPDDALLNAAARGELDTPEGLRKQVDRLISSPFFKDGVRAFFTDFFVMESFDTLSKDSTIYPGMTLKAIDEAREQLLRTVVDHLVTRHGDYRDLYTTRRTFISSDLGQLYRLPIDAGSQGWVPHEFPASDPHSGVLTQIGFLSQYAHTGRSSPTRRGRAIREVILCQKVPDPPPNVDFSNFEDPKSVLHTARERLKAHQENPVCAGCHRVMDPIGLTLENFDGAGQFRDTERGAPIDASGTLDGVAFKDAAGLGQALRDNASLKSCIVNRLYAYSVGQKITPAQTPLLKQYVASFDQQGYRFDDMLRGIIFDRTFFAVQPQPAGNFLLKTASLGDRHAH